MEHRFLCLAFLALGFCSIICAAPVKEWKYKNKGVKGSCNFDQNFCKWKNLQTDDFDWSRKRGRTPSSQTGPSWGVGGKGYYLFIEGSQPRRLGDTATLTSGHYNGVMCMEFYYHMYGRAIGTLEVVLYELSQFGQSTVMWSLSGNHGAKWRKARVTVFGVSYNILIKALVGKGYQSDIGLDNITMTDEVCYPDKEDAEKLIKSIDNVNEISQGTCNFDSGNKCQWVDDTVYDRFDWSITSGKTPTSGTGPDRDHGGKRGGKYAFIESSPPQGHGDNAWLLSPKLCGQACLGFYYHMYGNGAGKLNILRREGVAEGTDRIWFAAGNHGNKWYRAIVELNSENDCYQAIIEGVRGSTFHGDIAIDDLVLQEGSCCGLKSELNTLQTNGNCNFDKDFCGWRNWDNDDFDWTLGTLKTPSPTTGPTLGFGNKGGYAYIEASEPRTAGQLAVLISRILHGALCMRFHYHMYGDDIGSLTIYKKGDGIMEQLLWKQEGNQGNSWHEVMVSIGCNITSYQVELEAVVGGWRGDIAIDNVEFTPGACPDIAPTAAPNNTSPVQPTDFPFLKFNGFCDFTNDFCNWENDVEDDGEWRRYQGATPSRNTGPHSGYGGGSYLYSEASDKRHGEISRLLSDSVKSYVCLKFMYHMWGKDMGELKIETRQTKNDTWNTTWSLVGNQGNYWREGSITIPGYENEDYVIGITAVRGNSYTSDIAVDSIQLFIGSCDGNYGGGYIVDAVKKFSKFSCNFEKGNFCHWKNEKLGDQFDWSTGKRTPSGSTGPNRGHRKSKYFAYIEASSPRVRGDKARLSLHIGVNFEVCMSLFYHMYGATMGDLNIYTIENDTAYNQAKIAGGNLKNTGWKELMVEFHTTVDTVVVIEATRGRSYFGDIAIDDIAIRPGSCKGGKRKRRQRQRQ